MIPSSIKIHKKRICIICEGYEEEAYIKKIISIKVWNAVYNIKVINVKSNGNIYPRYQSEFQNDNYEIIFIICDTDKNPFSQYMEIKEKINRFHDNKNIADDIVIFTNPCTIQLVIFHFCEEILKSHKKYKSAPIIEEFTGVKDYDAHKHQIDNIMRCINKNNYKSMKKNILNQGKNYGVNGNTNFMDLIKYLESDNTDWIKELNAKILGNKIS